MPKTRKVKMSRKRVFRKNPIVQGPGFSCKPNIAFFMGYPLYRGGGHNKKRKKQRTLVLCFFLFLFVCFERLSELGGFGESGPDSPSLSGTRKGRLPRGSIRVNAGPYRGCPRVFDDFFFYVRGQESACPFMARLVLKSQGGGEPWCLDQPPLGRYPPLVGVLHGINSKA